MLRSLIFGLFALGCASGHDDARLKRAESRMMSIERAHKANEQEMKKIKDDEQEKNY